MSATQTVEVAVAIGLLCTTIPYFVIFSVLYFLRRKQQPIRSRGPLFQSIGNLFTIFWFLWGSIRIIIYEDHSCLFHQLAVFLLMPWLANSYLFRALYLYFRYQFTQSILVAADSDGEKKSGQCMEGSFFMKYRKFGRQRTLIKYYFVVFAVMLLLFLAYALAIGGFSPDFAREDAKFHCDSQGFRFVVAGGGVLYVGAISFLTWLLRDVREGFSIKTELKISVLSWVVYLVTYNGIILFVPDSSSMYIFNAGALMICFSISTTLQVYLTYNQPGSKEVTFSDIELEATNLKDLLEDKGGYLMFRDFLTMELCVENLLFWEEVNNYEKQNLEAEEALEEAKRIKQKYLVPGSQYEVNADYSVVQEISDKINSGNVSADLFDDVKQWIYELMRTDSFPRFIKQQKAKARK